MNAKQLVSAGVLAVVTTACGYSIKTATDYDRSVHFSNYQSFFIMKGNSSGNPLMDQRATADVETALISKGWLEVPEGQGQAAVVVHAATKTKHTYQTLYDGWGGGWRYRWGGIGGGATTFVEDYKVGSASDALSNNSKSNADATEQAINKMFNTFPPPSAVASAQ
jgi:hypothetical protein